MAKFTPDPVDLEVGQMIRARRKQLGISQTALAEALGISFQQVQKYEKASNRVSCSALVAIARKLECAPGDLLPTSTQGGISFAPLLAMASTTHGLEIVNAFLGMDQRRRKGFLGIARALDVNFDASDDLNAEEPGSTYVTGGDLREAAGIAAP